MQELWECETVEQIARWLLDNSEYYFELALEEAEQIMAEKENASRARALRASACLKKNNKL